MIDNRMKKGVYKLNLMSFILCVFFLVLMFSCRKSNNKSIIKEKRFHRIYESNDLYNMNESTYPELDSFGQELKLHHEIFGGKGGRMTYSITLRCEGGVIESEYFDRCFFRSYRKYATENEFCSLGAYGRNRDKSYTSKYKQLVDLIDANDFFNQPDLSDKNLFGTSHFFVLQRKLKGKISQIYLEPKSEDDPIWKALDLFSELTPDVENCEISDSNFKYRSKFTN